MLLVISMNHIPVSLALTSIVLDRISGAEISCWLNHPESLQRFLLHEFSIQELNLCTSGNGAPEGR